MYKKIFLTLICVLFVISTAQAGMVAHWTLDQGDYVGGLYVDDSNGGHDAAVTGTPVFVSGVEPNLSNEGVQLARLDTDPNGRATAGTWDPSESTGEFTLSAWVKWDGTLPDGHNRDILTKADNWPTTRWLLRVYTSSQIAFYNYERAINCVSSEVLDANEWTHICATFDDSNSLAILYIDGQEDTRDTDASEAGGSDATIRLGYSDQADAGFPGVLDDLRIYDHALSDVEVAALYTDFKPIPSYSVFVEPEQIVVFPGEEAVYTAEISEPNVTAAYQWYEGQSGDANNPLANETGHISGSDSNQLTIITQFGDSGYYWCKAVVSGNDYASDAVSLGVKGMMVAHWTLDQNDYVGGLYVDDSNGGHDATVTGTPVFVSGVEPNSSNEGVQLALLDSNPNGRATAGTWAPSEFTDEFTLSAWVKWDGTSLGDVLVTYWSRGIAMERQSGCLECSPPMNILHSITVGISSRAFPPMLFLPMSGHMFVLLLMVQIL